MFPFKCHEFEFEGYESKKELRSRFQNDPVINKSRQGFDWEITGSICNNSASLKTIQKYYRNSFRAVAQIKWEEKNTTLFVQGYFKVGTGITLVTLLLPMFGLYLSIKIGNVIPVIFTSLVWVVMFATLGKYLFEKDLKNVKEKVFNFLDAKNFIGNTESYTPEWKLNNLRLMLHYFDFHSKEQPLFRPEYTICLQIVQILELPDKTPAEKLEDCANCYNKILDTEHYDGLGWLDFQIRLQTYFRYLG